jgi:hypothetical protein
MKTAEFMDVVPRSFKKAAYAVSACSVLACIAVMVGRATQGYPLAFLKGMALGLVGAVFVSTWLLCLGYVHADARRRAMPPWLWTLIAAFIPNLLGFLLYFACRRAIAVPCPHCNQANAPGQRFCSWCGHPASGPLASGGVLA